MYSALGLLVVASLWNAWPFRDGGRESNLPRMPKEEKFDELNSKERETLWLQKRKLRLLGAGCSTCKETIEVVKRLAGSSHEVVIHDMQKSDVASKAKEYGVRSVPAVVVDGKVRRMLRRTGTR